jgi:hypothetical protein
VDTGQGDSLPYATPAEPVGPVLPPRGREGAGAAGLFPGLKLDHPPPTDQAQSPRALLSPERLRGRHSSGPPGGDSTRDKRDSQQKHGGSTQGDRVRRLHLEKQTREDPTTRLNRHTIGQSADHHEPTARVGLVSAIYLDADPEVDVLTKNHVVRRHHTHHYNGCRIEL